MSKPLIRNAFANVLQTLAGAVLLFALYRYISVSLGVEQLGIWSVVLATASTVNLADLGLGAGVVRFVARDRARGHSERAAQVVDTAALTLTVSAGGLLVLLYPLLAEVLARLFGDHHLEQALVILPCALTALWLAIVGNVFQGALDGCERMDLRAALVVGGQALLLALAFWLVPQYGLMGLAWAQVIQALAVAVIGRMMLCRAMPGLSLVPTLWKKSVLREMLGFGFKIQVATLFNLLRDPIAKALMARFGGPAAAGYFEIANQVVIKVRSIIVMANGAIVPHAAALAETESDRLPALYHENIQILIYVTLPPFVLLFAWAGGISWLLTGAFYPEFVLVLGLLCFAWGVNIFCSPAYFINLGVGRIGWNMFAHVIMGVLNGCLGWLLGGLYGARGVVFAYCIAITVASVGLIVAFQRLNRLNPPARIGGENLWLFAASLLTVVIGALAPIQQDSFEDLSGLAVRVLLPFVALGLAAWFHPMRRRLSGRLITRDVRA